MIKTYINFNNAEATITSRLFLSAPKKFLDKAIVKLKEKSCKFEL